jgi:hypothetical protein
LRQKSIDIDAALGVEGRATLVDRGVWGAMRGVD